MELEKNGKRWCLACGQTTQFLFFEHLIKETPFAKLWRLIIQMPEPEMPRIKRRGMKDD